MRLIIYNDRILKRLNIWRFKRGLFIHILILKQRQGFLIFVKKWKVKSWNVLIRIVKRLWCGSWFRLLNFKRNFFPINAVLFLAQILQLLVRIILLNSDWVGEFASLFQTSILGLRWPPAPLQNLVSLLTVDWVALTAWVHKFKILISHFKFNNW